MKIIKVIGHPVLVMSLFLLLLISGESFGGFYVIYLLLGLPHGVPDAIVGIAGLGAMLAGYKVYRSRYHPLKPLLYIAANGIMIWSLVLFFQSSKGYNDPTFHQTVPILSFCLFGLCVLCNLVLSVIILLGKGFDRNGKHLKAVQP